MRKKQKIQKKLLSKDAQPVLYNLEENVKYIESKLANCHDIIYRPIKIGKGYQVDAYIFFAAGMVDVSFIAENVLKPLIMMELNKRTKDLVYQEIYDQLLPSGDVNIEEDLDSLIMELLIGSIGILMENQSVGFTIQAIGWKERSVEESASESVVKGMRAGFVENIGVNVSLLRRMIRSPRLKIEEIILGKVTHTKINIAYVDGIVMEGLVEEVKQRINRIEVDGVISIGSLQEMIDDSVFSIFSQSFSTERPDRAASCLLEGRIVILMNNSPFVLVVPTTIGQIFQAADDYSSKYIVASLTRQLRFFSLMVMLSFSGLYVAIFSYHHEMIPTELLKTISQAREQLPFPIFLEMLLLEISFEVLREAGVRLPRPVGQAVSIVGALVIGQATVAAGLVSPPSIIIVAITAIASFTIPITETADSFRIIRFFVLLSGGILGLPGIMTVLFIILIHMSSLRSFGVPYLAPVSPFTLFDWKDFMIRVPMVFMKRRPQQIAKSNNKRQGWWKLRGGK